MTGCDLVMFCHLHGSVLTARRLERSDGHSQCQHLPGPDTTSHITTCPEIPGSVLTRAVTLTTHSFHNNYKIGHTLEALQVPIFYVVVEENGVVSCRYRSHRSLRLHGRATRSSRLSLSLLCAA